MCVVMLVSMTESTADMLALGEIVERPADEKTIAAGLRADTLGSALSPLFNGFMCSAFAQNIGLVAMTRIRSRFVVACGGGFPGPHGPLAGRGLAHLGRAPPGPRRRGRRPLRLGRGQRHPDPRQGGPGEGQQRPDRGRLAGRRHHPDHGAGVLPRLPETAKIILDSGISTGCVAAVLLNVVFNHLGRRRDDDEVTAPMEPGEEISGSRAAKAAHVH